ncbi:hypothetical protein Tco_0837516, partial [Tanacetum coccineum]
YYEENINHKDQTDKVIDAARNSLDKNSIARGDLLNALNGVTETLKAIQDAVKEDLVLNKKVIEATKAYTKNSTHITELLTLIKNFDFQGFKSSVESLQATALSQDKHLAECVKSSTSIAWNLGPRMTAIENSQAEIRNEVSSLRKDTSNIKSMMIEIYQAFKEGQQMENVTPTITEEPPSHTEEETEDMETQDSKKDKVEKEQVSKEPKHDVPILSVKPTETPEVQPITTIISTSQPEPYVPQREGKGIATDEHLESPPKLVKASYAVHPNPDAPILVPYMINGKLLYLTEEQILAHMDKEDQIKKAEEEAKRLAMIKTEAGEKFKKAQDAEMQVHKRQHTEKVEMLIDLNKKRAEQYNLLTLLLSLNNLHPNPQELEPKIKVPGLECNISLPEGVPFVNNLVVEEPEYRIFFTDMFDLRECLILPEAKKLIAEHLDQEKLQSKRVKLEAVGYLLD